MSRLGDSDEGADYNNAYELWQHNLQRALVSPRGKKALTELREALLALPEKKLIERALCTVGGAEKRPVLERDYSMILEENGEGVCAVGAYIWWKKVKAGMDPQAAFASLPTLEDENHDMWETADAAKAVGMAGVLAWHLAYQNDETFRSVTPSERYVKFMAWLDTALATNYNEVKSQ